MSFEALKPTAEAEHNNLEGLICLIGCKKLASKLAKISDI